MVFVVGVDGCNSGWIAVALNNGRFAGAAMYESFASLVHEADDAFTVGVDIPIGLLAEGQRYCDGMVKELLGPRRNSLFLAPPRAAIEAETYDMADALTRNLMGKGLPKQAYNLRDKVLEVDSVVRHQIQLRKNMTPYFTSRQLMMRKEPKSALRKYARIIEPDEDRKKRLEKARPAGRIIEVHPEASFAEMAGKPLSHDKKSYNGVMMRLRLLERMGIKIPLEVDEIGGVQIDDVLDAAAVAWTAHRYAMQRARCLPERQYWQHDGEQVIAIWI